MNHQFRYLIIHVGGMSMFIYQYMDLNVLSLCTADIQAPHNRSEIGADATLGMEFMLIADRLLGLLMKSEPLQRIIIYEIACC